MITNKEEEEMSKKQQKKLLTNLLTKYQEQSEKIKEAIVQRKSTDIFNMMAPRAATGPGTPATAAEEQTVDKIQAKQQIMTQNEVAKSSLKSVLEAQTNQLKSLQNQSMNLKNVTNQHTLNAINNATANLPSTLNPTANLAQNITQNLSQNMGQQQQQQQQHQFNTLNVNASPPAQTKTPTAQNMMHQQYPHTTAMNTATMNNHHHLMTQPNWTQNQLLMGGQRFPYTQNQMMFQTATHHMNNNPQHLMTSNMENIKYLQQTSGLMNRQVMFQDQTLNQQTTPQQPMYPFSMPMQPTNGLMAMYPPMGQDVMMTRPINMVNRSIPSELKGATTDSGMFMKFNETKDTPPEPFTCRKRSTTPMAQEAQKLQLLTEEGCFISFDKQCLVTLPKDTCANMGKHYRIKIKAFCRQNKIALNQGFVKMRVKYPYIQIGGANGNPSEWATIRDLTNKKPSETWKEKAHCLLTEEGCDIEILKGNKIYLPIAALEKDNFQKLSMTRFSKRFNIDLSQSTVRVRIYNNRIEVMSKLGSWVTRETIKTDISSSSTSTTTTTFKKETSNMSSKKDMFNSNRLFTSSSTSNSSTSGSVDTKPPKVALTSSDAMDPYHYIHHPHAQYHPGFGAKRKRPEHVDRDLIYHSFST